MTKDELGDRIKSNYENRAKTYLTRRTPVIVRIDGKAFHTLTRKFNKPFDIVFGETMHNTALSLCKEISGCVGAYVQSDEISLLLIDYKTLQTDAWFDYAVQKVSSVCASLATMYFNKHFPKLVTSWGKDGEKVNQYFDQNLNILTGCFDARCFNIPKEEVSNYFIWRQNDASKNSVQMLARSLFKHKDLQGLNLAQLQDKMVLEKDTNWNDLVVWQKRGVFIKRNEELNNSWVIDYDMPILSANKNYINELVYVGE